MEWIARQQYVKVQREVDGLVQKDIEYERFIYLYPDRVVTAYRSFPIQDVLDMSYRKIAGEGGLLYVHTIGGVFSYTVKTSPDSFVRAFRDKLK
jgi:hypothetical protein